MPRPKKPTPLVIPTNSLVASAVRYPGQVGRIYRPNQDWQKECYRHYSICGEARFAARFMGHALSRAVLGVGRKSKGEVEPETTGPAFDYLHALFNGKDGQEQMLESIGLHFTIAGECYLVGRKVENEEVWEIISPLEMSVSGDKWTIKYGDGQADVILTKEDVVIRMWLPNPARRIEADSPFRSLLPILTEIEYLTRHIFAQTQSRLAGAGVWILPQGLTFPPPPTQSGQEQTYANEADAAMASVGHAMIEPLDDPGNPAALVPTFLQVPDDLVDKIKEPIHFWSPLDATARELRTEAIQRFAIGMELPPEQVLGMSSNSGTGGGNSNGVSHWGAWQIEESTIKMFVEPMLSTVVNSLTIGYLRPLTEDTDVVVTFSTAALRLRPDRSQEALELYDRGILSIETVLVENGFDITDKPDDLEYHEWLLRKLASGSATPEQVGAALLLLGVDIGVPTDNVAPRESRPPPSLEEHPSRPRDPSESALVAACDALVYRALERVGNRLRQSAGGPVTGVPSYETHVMIPVKKGNEKAILEDAWSCAPQVLSELTTDPEAVIATLSGYTEMLLRTQTRHARASLKGWLNGGWAA